MRTTTGRLQQDGVSHADQDQNRRACARSPCRHRQHRLHHTIGRGKRPWLGIGGALIGAAVVGSAIAASNDGYYYDGYRRCACVRQFEAYGNYMGRVRTCNY
jgi:hypothetical protein